MEYQAKGWQTARCQTCQWPTPRLLLSEQCAVDWGIPVYDRNPNDQCKCGDRMGMDKPWNMQYNGLQHYIFAVFYNCYSNSSWEDISYTPALL